jgi:hypothetical protein
MADACYLVDAGIALIVNAIDTADVYKYVAWGTGATGAAANNTAMETAAAPTNATAETGTLAKATTNTTDDTLTVTATITAGGDLAITEVGVFNQATLSGATMFSHGTFSAINLTSGDSIAFTISHVLNQA